MEKREVVITIFVVFIAVILLKFGGFDAKLYDIISASIIDTRAVTQTASLTIFLYNSSYSWDKDNDGINDTYDFIYGDADQINFTGVTNMNISYGGYKNINTTFDSNFMDTFSFYDGNIPLMEFPWITNSTNILNLSNITIIANSTTLGSYEVHGIFFPNMSMKKTIYITDVDATKDKICIKDSDGASISAMSSDCSSSDEVLLTCDGVSRNGYSCTDTGDYYKVTGSNYTAAKESDAGAGGGESDSTSAKRRRKERDVSEKESEVGGRATEIEKIIKDSEKERSTEEKISPLVQEPESKQKINLKRLIELVSQHSYKLRLGLGIILTMVVIYLLSGGGASKELEV